jgi:hypothetical protein
MPENLPVAHRKYCGIHINASYNLKPCAWPALVQWDTLETPMERLTKFKDITDIILEMESNRPKVIIRNMKKLMSFI